MSSKLRKLNKEIRSQSTFQEGLQELAGGQWTLTPPDKPGTYLCRARHDENGHLFISRYEVNGSLNSTQSWGGWWWSVPLPDFPFTPDCIPKKTDTITIRGRVHPEIINDLRDVLTSQFPEYNFNIRVMDEDLTILGTTDIIKKQVRPWCDPYLTTR